MKETLSVEYISRSINKKEKDDKAFLDGFVGEVDKNAFIRALRELKGLNERGGSANNIRVPVRFCLNFPASNIGFYPRWGFGDTDIEEQGVLLPIKNLRPTKKKPFSKYERRLLESPQLDVKAVFEKPVYYYTASLSRLLNTTRFLSSVLGSCWTWSKESRVASSDKRIVFLEARIYGADTVVPVYSTSRFQGVVVQIFTRDLAAGYQERMASDIYLMANTREYVEYLDGTVLERELLPSSLKDVLNTSLITPKDFMFKKAETKAKELAAKQAAEATKAAAELAAGLAPKAEPAATVNE